MTDQLALNWDATRGKTIDARFADFHAKNPQVYAELARLARQAKKNGHHKIGIELLFAVLRWERMMQTTGDSGFKLNDHFTSRYARLLMQREPDLDGLFETRAVRAA
jgi:cytochrome b